MLDALDAFIYQRMEMAKEKGRRDQAADSLAAAAADWKKEYPPELMRRLSVYTSFLLCTKTLYWRCGLLGFEERIFINFFINICATTPVPIPVRSSEVYFKPQTDEKALSVREVKAEHIGKFITVRGLFQCFSHSFVCLPWYCWHD